MKNLLILLLSVCTLVSKAQTTTEIQTFLNASQSDLYVTGQGSQTALNQNIMLATAGSGSTDTQGATGVNYRSFFILIVPAAGTVTAGAITFEGSNDNFVSAALPIFVYDLNSWASGISSSFNLAASCSAGGAIPEIQYWQTFKLNHVSGVTSLTTNGAADVQYRIIQAIVAKLDSRKKW